MKKAKGILSITETILETIFKPGSFSIQTGLPEDARFVSAFIEPTRNSFGLIFERDTIGEGFYEVAEGNEIPRLVPVIMSRKIPTIWNYNKEGLIYFQCMCGNPMFWTDVSPTKSQKCGRCWRHYKTEVNVVQS